MKYKNPYHNLLNIYVQYNYILDHTNSYMYISIFHIHIKKSSNNYIKNVCTTNLKLKYIF